LQTPTFVVDMAAFFEQKQKRHINNKADFYQSFTFQFNCEIGVQI
jgi:hypothetical protein